MSVQSHIKYYEITLKLEPLVSRSGFLCNSLNNRVHFSVSFKRFTTLSYLNLIPDSERTNYFSNLDLNDCLNAGKCETFSRFVDNYKNTVHNLNYKVENVQSYFKSASDPSNELEYELIWPYAYYLKTFNGSLCLFRTLVAGHKRIWKERNLEQFILRNGKVLLNFSELSKQGINNVKKLRISPNGHFISVLYDPYFNDTQKVRFYSILRGRLFDSVLEDVGEIYLISHTPNSIFTRIYYTQLNSHKRSCKLFTSLIHNRIGYVCSKKLIFREPVHYISLYKSKNGKALFAATVSYNKVFLTFLISEKGKMYVIPTTNDTKTFLEYRNRIIYRICSNLVSQISLISVMHLKPYRLRFGRKNFDTNYDLKVDGIKLDYIVTDIDMFEKGLVLYLMKPPSTPRVAILPLGKRKLGHGRKLIDGLGGDESGLDTKDLNNIKQIKHFKTDESSDEGIVKIREVPIKVGIIEPTVNVNYYSNLSKFNINSPGLSEVRMELNLDTLEVKKSKGNDVGISSFVLEVPSKDGSCKIPVTIVTKGEGISESRDIVRRKCMLYVYGFYGENLKVCNYMEHHPLLEMEYILCFAHVRGGGELGEEWHKMGNKCNKHNSFYDLIDVMKYLIGKNITTSSRLALNVSSASGILGGCVYNMNPELCSVIIFKLPYLDLFATATDASNALVELEYEEFGNTHDDTGVLEHVYSLDPCTNVRNNGIKRPILIINCDENDVRAPWYHTAKFVTILNQNQGNRDIYIKVSNYGHDGCPPDDYLMRTCSEYVSLVDHFLNKNTQSEF